MPLFKDVGRLSIAALFLYGAAVTSTVAQDANQGGRLAEKYCARCHAIGTTGDSPHPSAPPFRAIAAKGNVDDLQEALAEGISVGHPDMPEFELPPEQVASFLAYLKSLAPSGR